MNNNCVGGRRKSLALLEESKTDGGSLGEGGGVLVPIKGEG